MKPLRSGLVIGASVAAALGLAAQADALVNTCSAAAIPGCSSPGGSHTYIETRSSKTGGAAAYICTQLSTASGAVAGNCGYDTTFIRVCWYGGGYVFGSHWGSSAAWVVNGRDATASDATTC